MNDRKQSVCLALIHNNNAGRNSYIRPFLNALRTRLLERFAIIEAEVSNQPEIKAHRLPMALLRDSIYQLLIRQWCRYRLIRPQFFLFHAPRFLLKSISKYSRGQEIWKKNSSIEMVITDKHIRVWTAFLETSGDFLICFEDDAVFKDDSIQRVGDLLETLFERNSESLIYIDLAGGCQLEELQIGRIEKSREFCFRHYSKPVTNTACVYLMSRPLVAAFHEMIIRNPWFRLIGIDWMMNKLFIELVKDGVKCDCIHADPTIFRHGTTTGEYVSWQAQGPN